MTPPFDTMTEANFVRLMGWKDAGTKRGSYRVIGRDPVHRGDDRMVLFQACKTYPAALKSAATAQGKRFRLQDVRIVAIVA